jgi:hypothetical protein
MRAHTTSNHASDFEEFDICPEVYSASNRNEYQELNNFPGE